MGSNLKYKGIKEVLNNIGPDSMKEKSEPTVAEVNNDWKRLASFMSGQK
jgi:hypothetical protein